NYPTPSQSTLIPYTTLFRSFKKDRPPVKGKEITLNYLTPHNKWSIHSMYYDAQPMLTLFRGGPTIWLNKDDANDAGIEDNDWIRSEEHTSELQSRFELVCRL